jgi:hypothetical protein
MNASVWHVRNKRSREPPIGPFCKYHDRVDSPGNMLKQRYPVMNSALTQKLGGTVTAGVVHNNHFNGKLVCVQPLTLGREVLPQ